MPDAWEILKENSSLSSGNAWEHLNNQQGNGDSCAGIELFPFIEDVDMSEVLYVETSSCIIEIEDEVILELTENEFTLEVTDE